VRKTELFSRFSYRFDDQSMIAVTDDPRVDILRSLPPVKLEKDCAAAVYGDFTEHFPVKQILPHDPECLLDPGAVEALVNAHFAFAMKGSLSIHAKLVFPAPS
jgi:hypothetical protein